MNGRQKIQFIMGIVLLAACLSWAYLGAQSNYKLGLYLLTGLALGYILARSQYGFAGIIRKLYRQGNADLARAVIFLLFITTMAILSLQFIAQKNGMTVPAMSSVKPNSLLTVIGGLIFGMGMIFAGGCASGTLAGMGELYVGSFFAIVFFCLGSLAGVWHLDSLNSTLLARGPKIYMPDYFGYAGSLVFVGIMYLLILYFLQRYERYRMKKGSYVPGPVPEGAHDLTKNEDVRIFSLAAVHKVFREHWKLSTGSILLSIVFITITVTTGKNWGITSTFIYWGGWMLEPLGVDVQGIGYFSESASRTARFTGNTILTDPGSLRNIGIFLGPLIFALTSWSAQFKMNWKWRNVLSFSIGGLLMGYGARLSDGCNIGAFYSALSSMSFSGFIFGAFMFLGAYLALKLVDRFKLSC